MDARDAEAMRDGLPRREHGREHAASVLVDVPLQVVRAVLAERDEHGGHLPGRVEGVHPHHEEGVSRAEQRRRGHYGRHQHHPGAGDQACRVVRAGSEHEHRVPFAMRVAHHLGDLVHALQVSGHVRGDARVAAPSEGAQEEVLGAPRPVPFALRCEHGRVARAAPQPHLAPHEQVGDRGVDDRPPVLAADGAAHVREPRRQRAARAGGMPIRTADEAHALVLADHARAGIPQVGGEEGVPRGHDPPPRSLQKSGGAYCAYVHLAGRKEGGGVRRRGRGGGGKVARRNAGGVARERRRGEWKASMGSASLQTDGKRIGSECEARAPQPKPCRGGRHNVFLLGETKKDTPTLTHHLHLSMLTIQHNTLDGHHSQVGCI